MDDKKQRENINTLYIMLIICTISSFVPYASAQILALALALVVLIAAYYYKARSDEDTLLYNHMTYMIGTIWIGTTFLVLGIIGATYWVYTQGDHSVIQSTIDNINSGTMYDEASLTQVMKDYMTANQSLIVRSSLLTVGPPILYFVYRVANGFSRSMRGYRIANPKSWL